jgi:hypothetical protein
VRRLLRAWLWMLLVSLAIGLAIGTCVRREAEGPARYIGQATPEAPARRG